MLNLPLADGIGVRLLGWKVDQNEGEYLNTFNGRYLDANDQTGVRGVLTAGSGPLRFTLIGEYSGADLAGTNVYFPGAGETKKTMRAIRSRPTSTRPTVFPASSNMMPMRRARSR